MLPRLKVRNLGVHQTEPFGKKITKPLEQEMAKRYTTYWIKPLRPHYENQQENIGRTLGKRKRAREQFEFCDAGATTSAKKDSRREKKLSDCNNSVVSAGSDEDEEDDSPLPPLLATVDGHTEVLGFNARQRKAFLKSLMKFGAPPKDIHNSQWMVSDLRSKSKKVLEAYTSLFMQHLSETGTDDPESFADGVPREGFNRLTVLARFGVMALIRKKVQEYEKGNGEHSIPGAARKAKDLAAPSTAVEGEASSSTTSTTANPATRADPNSASTSGEINNMHEKNKFMFNIAEGGFSKLDYFWSVEDKVAGSQEIDCWNRRHDYWLLAGVVTHGYGCWQDMQADSRFDIIHKPLLKNRGPRNLPTMTNIVLATRFKFLEQALVIEEQLRRAALNLTQDANHPSAEAQRLAVSNQTVAESLTKTEPANMASYEMLTAVAKTWFQVPSSSNSQTTVQHGFTGTAANLMDVTPQCSLPEESAP